MDAIAEAIEGSEAPAIAPAGVDADRRKRTRRGYLGFGLGIVFCFAYTAFLVERYGYHHLQALAWNLIWLPLLGLFLGRRVGSPRRIGPRTWRLPQFELRTLMVAVAYVALLCGVGVTLVPLGNLSLEYLQKAISSQEMAKAFRGQIPRFEAEAKLRRESVEQLRAGKIPEALMPGQRDFLRSLETDPKVTPQHREYRRGLITEGEELLRDNYGHAADVTRRLVEHFERLAAKYEKARWRPWVPIEPDPPTPDTK